LDPWGGWRGRGTTVGRRVGAGRARCGALGRPGTPHLARYGGVDRAAWPQGGPTWRGRALRGRRTLNGFLCGRPDRGKATVWGLGAGLGRSVARWGGMGRSVRGTGAPHFAGYRGVDRKAWRGGVSGGPRSHRPAGGSDRGSCLASTICYRRTEERNKSFDAVPGAVLGWSAVGKVPGRRLRRNVTTEGVPL
jgi:hypothetical protein